MNVFKCYRALTNSMYRLIVNILIPLVAAIIGLITSSLWGLPALIAVASIVVMIEVVGDYFGFGGICKKGGLGMEYLKTSFDGMNYLGKAILMDLIVRPFRIALFVLVAGFHYKIEGGNVKVLLLTILIVSCISVIALNVTRYIDVLQIHYFISAIFVLLAMGGCAMAFLCSAFIQNILIISLGIVLCLAIALTYYHMGSKIAASYRDL